MRDVGVQPVCLRRNAERLLVELGDALIDRRVRRGLENAVGPAQTILTGVGVEPRAGAPPLPVCSSERKSAGASVSTRFPRRRRGVTPRALYLRAKAALTIAA
jgi:hypothetical protein